MPGCMNELQESNTALKPIFDWPLIGIIGWLLLITIIFNPIVLTFVYLLSSNLELDERSLILLQSLISGFVTHCAFLVVILYMLRNEGISFCKFGIHFKGNFGLYGFCLILGALLEFSFVHFQFVFLQSTPLTPLEFPKSYWWFVLWFHLISVGFLIPLVEEILFRGILFRSLLSYTNAGAAIAINIAVFLLCHIWVIEYTIDVIGIALVGCVSCIIYLKTRELVNAILFHMTWNIAATIQTYFP